MSRDGESIISVGEEVLLEYSIRENSWRQSSFDMSRGCDDDNPCLGTGVDPATGLIYFQSKDDSEPSNRLKIVQYNPSTGDRRYIASNKETSSILAWDDVDKALILVSSLNTALDLVMPSWKLETGWVNFTVGGTVPSPRNFPCLVSAYGGTKQILFGGASLYSYYSDIYILDLERMRWSQGKSAGIEGARKGMACAVTDDYFIAWGGDSASGSVKSNVTLIYNMKTNEWQTTFLPQPSKNSLGIGAIIGVVVGGLAAIAGAIGLYIFIRRRRASATIVNNNDKEKKKSGDQERRDPQEATSARDPQDILMKRDPQGILMKQDSQDISMKRGPQLYAGDNNNGGLDKSNNHHGQDPSIRNPQVLTRAPFQNYGFDMNAGHIPREPHLVLSSGYIEPRSSMRSNPIPALEDHLRERQDNDQANISNVGRGGVNHNGWNRPGGQSNGGGMHELPVHPPHALSPLLNGTFGPAPEMGPRHPVYISARYGNSSDRPNYYYDTVSTIPNLEQSQRASRPQQPQD
ncbi:hypothetical protein BGW38_004225 [Lunasporangiospora selenospora]|uniref:Uncharacterized protein n=1 Tax=Lunasporangiospora selenospora TaxID=979761 RepID=A0A9P6FQ33_9FUNG|nr:hypothetical protein BGW38_004225 [Lunasporangiospora selenospora]